MNTEDDRRVMLGYMASVSWLQSIEVTRSFNEVNRSEPWSIYFIPTSRLSALSRTVNRLVTQHGRGDLVDLL